MKTIRLLLTALLMLQIFTATGQKYMVNIPITQQDPRIHVTLMYQEKNNAFGMMTQDYRITVRNNTADKLKVNIDFGARLICGTEKSHKLGPLGDGITIAPSQTVGKPYGTDGIGSAVRLTESACPKDSWKKMGNDETGSQLYSMISYVHYRIVSIENLSEKERAAAQAKKQKAEEEANQRRIEAEHKKQKAEEERARQERENSSKLAVKNTVSGQSSMGSVSSSSSSAGSPSTGLSEKVKVNGEYVQVYRQNGVPMMKRADGSIHQTTENAFSQITQSSEKAKNNANIAQQQIQQQQLQQQQIAAQQAEYQRKLEADRLYRQQLEETITQGVAEVANYIGGIIEHNRAEKERQRALEAERSERERERQYQLYLQQTNRKNAFAILPAKDIPLATQEKASNIYFFIYAHNDLSSESGAMAYVSNVFEIGKYRDGTRAYTANIKKEIENLTPYNEVLHGYYYTFEDADQTRENLIHMLQSNATHVENVSYKGKPTAYGSDGSQPQEASYGTIISESNPKTKMPPAATKKESEKSSYGTLIK